MASGNRLSPNRNDAGGIQRQGAKQPRRKAGRNHFRPEGWPLPLTEGCGPKPSAKKINLFVPLPLGVLALNGFCIVPAKSEFAVGEFLCPVGEMFVEVNLLEIA